MQRKLSKKDIAAFVEKRKKEKTREEITKVKLTRDQYEILRIVYFNTGSIAQAASAASCTETTAAKYVKKPHKKHSPDESIDQWCARAREESTRVTLRKVANLRSNMVAQIGLACQSMLDDLGKITPVVEGDDTIEGRRQVGMEELGKLFRNLERGLAMIVKATGEPSGRHADDSGRGSGGDIHLHNHQTTIGLEFSPSVSGFQGQVDRGQIIEVPDTPVTLYDHQLALRKQYAPAFKLQGTKGHNRLLAAIRTGQEQHKAASGVEEEPEDSDEE